MTFVSSRGTTHEYLLKILITHNKNQISLLYLLINYISARSAPQILSVRDEHILRFLNFLIISLCNFSANYWFSESELKLIPVPVLYLHLIYLTHTFKLDKSFFAAKLDVSIAVAPFKSD